MEDEQILIKKAQKGESEAFGMLYDQYLPKIYRFVRVKVSHREEAEDITHQAFLNAWKNINDYTFQGHSFGSWLYRIARNVITDYYRKSKTGDVSLDEDLLPLNFHPKDTDSIERTADINLQHRAIFDAVRNLKEIEQDVIIMRFLEGMSIKETSEIIKKSEGATKVIQHRALKQVRDILEKMYHE
ncbi:MAG: sigma-70 family RNA polymerase sigma factor [bacterium]